VTHIAVKLAQSMKDLHLTVKKSPDQPRGSPGRRAQYNARETLKLLVTVSQRLASQLKAGEDKDATLPTYDRMEMLRRDAEGAGRKARIPSPTLDKVVGTRALLDQLAPYYEDAPAAAPTP